MDRRNFLLLTGGSIVIAGVSYYSISDKSNFVRTDLPPQGRIAINLLPDERKILYLASLAPSGHNTQPWLIKRIEPLHWIICNDKSKWLPAVDPAQRETMLSIGAFIQNLEYAANNLGYVCQFNLMARTNQEEEVMELKLVRSAKSSNYNIENIIQRRTIRSDVLSTELKMEDVRLLTDHQPDLIHFIPNKSRFYGYLNEQTIEANKIQSYRDPAQRELARWIRFYNKDARQHRDGLSTGSMEIKGISGWVVRNFYGKSNVMSDSFRNHNIHQVEQQVSSSAGWFLITSKDQSIRSLIETGMRMQRLFLKVKGRNIALHPMTQILEEPSIHQGLSSATGINDSVQFILRTGYVKNYPAPVSLRRPVDWLVRTV